MFLVIFPLEIHLWYSGKGNGDRPFCPLSENMPVVGKWFVGRTLTQQQFQRMKE